MLDILEALDSRIRIEKSLSSWEEAIKISGLLLKEDNIITQQYIEKMINVAKQLGPYVVIAPGIAIPHARPEDGAKKFGLSLLVIKDGVSFNSHNDPVFLVLSFATPDSQSHLKFLQQLATILQNSTELVEKIRNTSSTDDIINYLKNLLSAEEEASA